MNADAKMNVRAMERCFNIAGPWDEKLFTRDETFEGKTIHIIGL